MKLRPIIIIFILTLIGLITVRQNGFGQVESADNTPVLETTPLISGIHTLSIHVRDTITHDSVFQFLADKLLLPVYYYPEKYGQQKYAGIYAGNMVLEPCGPFSNIDYATQDFKAIFFGMNFEVYRSLVSSEQELNNRGIKHQVNNGSIYIRDSILCNENVFTALYEVRDKEKRDSLRNTLITNKKSPGIEYIKEIFIGYNEEVNFLKWKEFLYPLEIGKNGVCQINDSLQIHFTRGNINEVKGIVFKVKSIEKAKNYLLKERLLRFIIDDTIELDKSRTFGLSISLTEKK